MWKYTCVLLAGLFPWPLAASAQVALLADGGESEARIEAGLAKRISIQFVDTPLRDVMQHLADRAGLSIKISKKIEDAGVQIDQPITFSADHIGAESALRLMLRELNLSFIIQNEKVIITTVEDSQSPENLTSRVYPVADLLDVVRISAYEGGGLELDYASLIETITTTIEPDSWSDVGGPGSIREFENSRSLVISQRRDLHQRVAALLTTLRQAKGAQGIRSLSLPAADIGRPATPLRLSAPLPVPNRAAPARIRVQVATPQPVAPMGGGGLF